jgi:hypothetical protein
VSLNLGTIEFGMLFRGSTGDEGRGGTDRENNNNKKLALNIEWYVR